MVFSEGPFKNNWELEQYLVILCGSGYVGYLWKSLNQSELQMMYPKKGVNSHFFHYNSGTARCKIKTNSSMTLDSEKGIEYDFSQTKQIYTKGILWKGNEKGKNDVDRIVLGVIYALCAIFTFMCMFCSLYSNWKKNKTIR